MTATLTNPLISPAAVDPGVYGSAPGAPPSGTAPGADAEKSFGATMQSVTKASDSKASGTLNADHESVSEVSQNAPVQRQHGEAKPINSKPAVVDSAEKSPIDFPLEVVADKPTGNVLPATGNPLPPGDAITDAGSQLVGQLAAPPNANPVADTPADVDADPVVSEKVGALLAETGRPITLAELKPDASRNNAAMLTQVTPLPPARPDALSNALRSGLAAEPDVVLTEDAGDSVMPLNSRTFAELAGQNAGAGQSSRESASRQYLEQMLAQTDKSSSLRSSDAGGGQVQQSLAPTGFSQTSSPTGLSFDSLMPSAQLANSRPLQPLIGSQAFSEGLSQRLMVMAGDGVQSARLRLQPESLGTLDVRIQIEDDTARVWFTATQGQTREALEAAMPRLRDLFAEQGMQLVKADVESGERDRHGATAFGADADSADWLEQDESTDAAGVVQHLYINPAAERGLDIYV